MRLVLGSTLMRWSVFLALTTAFGCKPPAGSSSESKTIDSFAANTKIRTNQCRAAEDVVDAQGNFNEAKYASKLILKDRIAVQVTDAALKADLQNEVNIALTSVPEFSQRLFAKMDGYIRITPKASEICGAFLGDSKNPNYVDKSVRDTVESCSLLSEKPAMGLTGGETQRSLTLVINANSAAIRHGLVRGFGYLHAQFYPRMRRNLAGGSKLYILDAVDTPAMKDLKDDLARSFFKDMLTSEADNGVFKVANLAHLLGKNTSDKSLAETLRDNLADEDGDLFAGLTLNYPGETRSLNQKERETRSQAIRDFIVAEGYDSLHCRPRGSYSEAQVNAATKPEDLASTTNTVKVFDKFFNATYKKYSGTLIPAFTSQAEEISAVIDGRASDSKVVEAASGSGFNLTADSGLMQVIQLLLSQASAPIQSQPAVSNLGSGSDLFFRPAAAETGTDNTLATNSGNGCPCGCNGPPCNCQCNGVCGPNCSCNGVSGSGVAQA